MRAVLAAIACLANACDTAPASTPRARPARVERTEAERTEVEEVEDDFVYRALRAEPSSAPTSFARPLPATPEEFRRPWHVARHEYPSPGYVQDRICAGDQEMAARWAAAVDAGSGLTTRDRLTCTYAWPGEACDEERAYCDWARGTIAERRGSDDFRAVVWIGFAGCDPALVEPLLDGDGVPPLAIVRFHRARLFDLMEMRAEIPPGFVDAVRAVVASDLVDHECSGFMPEWTRMAVETLAYMEGGVRALVALQRELPAHRAEIARALAYVERDDAQRLVRLECARDRREWPCTVEARMQLRDHLPVFHPRGVDPSALVRHPGFDPRLHEAAHPETRGSIRDALERCAREQTDHAAPGCLARLATVDWGRARRIAEERTGDETEVARNLRRYPDPSGLGAHLVEVGLLAAPPSAPGLTVLGTLEAGGALLRFRRDLAPYPPGYDSMLRQLAALAPAALGDVVFTEEVTGADTPATMVAFVGGERHAVQEDESAHGFDVESVVGMLNTLSRLRRAETRWRIAENDDSAHPLVTTIVVGTRAAFRRARGEGLLGGHENGSRWDRIASSSEAELRYVWGTQRWHLARGGLRPVRRAYPWP